VVKAVILHITDRVSITLLPILFPNEVSFFCCPQRPSEATKIVVVAKQ
jgi:hypothetical protein